MGQEIVYCFKCLTRLTGADFDRGKARRFGHRVACPACLPALLASLTPEEAAAFQAETRAGSPAPAPSSAKIRAATAPPAATPRAFRAASRPSPWPWVALGGGALFVLVLLILLSGSGDPRPAPAPPPPEGRAPVPAPKADPRLEEARALHARARTLELSSADLDAVVAAYEEALRKADTTPLFPEVLRAYDAVVARRKEARLKADLEADRAVQAALEREDFAAARALAEKIPGGNWPSRIRAHAEALLAELRAKAVDAPQRAALKERVSRWGYPDLLGALEAADGWRPLFDGRTTDFLLPATAVSWKVEDGALVPAATDIQPLKTKEEFGDVDLRLRFDFADASNFAFWGRQSHEGAMGVEWSRRELDLLRGGPHEYVLSLRGNRVELTLDGAPRPTEVRGRILKGPAQITGVGRGWRILGLDVRPAPPEPAGAWRTISDGRSLAWASSPSERYWAADGAGLVRKPGVKDTLQTRERFADGELRLTFELIGPLDTLTLTVRQGGGGRISTTLAGGRIKSLGPGRHEILMVCRGSSVKATVDGMAQDVYGTPTETTGHVQIGCTGDGLRILSLEWRDASR